MPRDTAYAGYVIRKPKPCCFIWSSRASYFRSTLPMRRAILYTDQTPQYIAISIPTPRAGSDMRIKTAMLSSILFQSLLPARGAILYHAERMHFFNPRSPYGSPITATGPTGVECMLFQSTLPKRRAEWGAIHHKLNNLISIPAPYAGSDQTATPLPPLSKDFNPRSPCAERSSRAFFTHSSKSSIFNPHSPYGERSGGTRLRYYTMRISIPAPRMGSN